MADLENDLRQDRALRNAAKHLLKADLGFLKGDVAEKGMGGRIAGRVKDGAADVAESAVEFAGEHKLQLGAGLVVAAAAFAGWMFRDRLGDAIYDLLHSKGPLEKAADAAEQLAEDARSFID